MRRCAGRTRENSGRYLGRTALAGDGADRPAAVLRQVGTAPAPQACRARLRVERHLRQLCVQPLELGSTSSADGCQGEGRPHCRPSAASERRGVPRSDAFAEVDEAFAMVVLASYSMATRGRPWFDGLVRLAEARDIPVIDQAGWILRQGGVLEDARWKHDWHWNPQGHQWAAEAVMEWLERNRSVCGERRRPVASNTPSAGSPTRFGAEPKLIGAARPRPVRPRESPALGGSRPGATAGRE